MSNYKRESFSNSLFLFPFLFLFGNSEVKLGNRIFSQKKKTKKRKKGEKKHEEKEEEQDQGSIKCDSFVTDLRT